METKGTQLFGEAEDLVTGDGPGLDAIWRLDCFSGIPEEKSGFLRKVMGCMPFQHLSEFDPSSTNLHRIFDLGR